MIVCTEELTLRLTERSQADKELSVQQSSGVLKGLSG